MSLGQVDKFEASISLKKKTKFLKLIWGALLFYEIIKKKLNKRIIINFVFVLNLF